MAWRLADVSNCLENIVDDPPVTLAAWFACSSNVWLIECKFTPTDLVSNNDISILNKLLVPAEISNAP